MGMIPDIGMGVLTLVCLGLVLFAVFKLHKEHKTSVKAFTLFAVSVSAWLVVVGILSLRGVFADFSSFPPKLTVVLVVPLLVTVFFSFQRRLTQFLTYAPLTWAVVIQSFRVAVEIFLWMLYDDGRLPVQMTFEGRNWDILAGITAIPAAWFLARRSFTTGLLIWNFLCLGLLANIVITAILSLPTPFRVFMNEPANTVVATFPIIWLPAFLVPLAYIMHIISIKQILAIRKS